MSDLLWKKFPILDDGFICLSDFMGSDAKIASRARTSYGNDRRYELEVSSPEYQEAAKSDETLIRYLMRHSHTSPVEFCEVEFLVRAPLYVVAQWQRHRTGSFNQVSGRYREMIDSMQETPTDKWRLQSTNNKQGSAGYLVDWPEHARIEEDYTSDSEGLPEACQVVTIPDTKVLVTKPNQGPGSYLSERELYAHKILEEVYHERLALGVAKEQARKDLPVCNYTEMYWKCDLHNLLHFLKLRMDPHAQEEIRVYANQIAEIVEELFPVTWQAFVDYRLNALTLTALDVKVIKWWLANRNNSVVCQEGIPVSFAEIIPNKRERTECVDKLRGLGLL